MIIKYKTFESSKKFEKWQEKNDVSIISIQAINTEIVTSGVTQFITKISVLVTYTENSTEEKSSE